jgi:NAD(P)-dependent dehydrogenase (short-subunit alcohol dehydrogenase family)
MSDIRLAIVTGATGAIGAAIARGLAADPTFEVLLLVRDESRGRKTTASIRSVTGNPRVRHAIVDVSERASIRRFAQCFDDKVHVLINNAAVAPRQRQLTREGREVVFATNVLGYYWLTLALEHALVAAAPARVINVASYWAGDLGIDDLEFERRRYDNHAAYRQSKQANRMLTVALAERYREQGITVNACHPGDVNSTLSNALGFGGSESAQVGARTPLWLATADEVSNTTGKYFADCREERCRFASENVAIQRLLAACESIDLQLDRG